MGKFILPFLAALSLYAQVTTFPVAGGGSGSTALCLIGSGLPSNLQGSNGACYVDIVTGNVYGPKSAGVWPLTPTTNIKGPQGPQGPAGNITSATSLQVGTGGTIPGYFKIWDSSGLKFIIVTAPTEITGSYCEIPPPGPPTTTGLTRQVSAVTPNGTCPNGDTATVVEYSWIALNSGGGSSGGFTYYIDPITGNDANAGTSISLAWLSQTPANAIALSGVQTIAYNTGGAWVLYRKLGMFTNETILTTAIITATTDKF